MSANVEQIVCVKPTLGQDGSSTQRSLVNSRLTPLQDGHVPPTVQPFGMTKEEHGSSGSTWGGINSRSPCATCWWVIVGRGLGQKQHCSPGEHLQSSLRWACGHRCVHDWTMSLDKLTYKINAKRYKTAFILIVLLSNYSWLAVYNPTMLMKRTNYYPFSMLLFNFHSLMCSEISTVLDPWNDIET